MEELGQNDWLEAGIGAGVIINIINAYAPQQGCTLEEKEVFWSDLEETVEMILREERVIVGADLSGHVGVGNNGDEDVMGRHGMGKRNDEGQAVVDFAKRMELVVSNTLFQKQLGRKITYSSGGLNTQVDYILLRRRRLKECSDTKVIRESGKTAQVSSQQVDYVDKMEKRS